MLPHGLYSPWNPPGQNIGVGSLSLLHGIFPTQGWNPGLLHCRQILYQLSHKGSPRILEWVAYPFSSGSSQPRNQTGVSCIAGDQLSYQGSPSRQENWSGLPFPYPGDLPDPGIKSTSLALQADSLLLSHQGSSTLSSRDLCYNFGRLELNDDSSSLCFL